MDPLEIMEVMRMVMGWQKKMISLFWCNSFNKGHMLKLLHQKNNEISKLAGKYYVLIIDNSSGVCLCYQLPNT